MRVLAWSGVARSTKRDSNFLPLFSAAARQMARSIPKPFRPGFWCKMASLASFWLPLAKELMRTPCTSTENLLVWTQESLSSSGWIQSLFLSALIFVVAVSATSITSGPESFLTPMKEPILAALATLLMTSRASLVSWFPAIRSAMGAHLMRTSRSSLALAGRADIPVRRAPAYDWIGAAMGVVWGLGASFSSITFSPVRAKHPSPFSIIWRPRRPPSLMFTLTISIPACISLIASKSFLLWFSLIVLVLTGVDDAAAPWGLPPGFWTFPSAGSGMAAGAGPIIAEKSSWDQGYQVSQAEFLLYQKMNAFSGFLAQFATILPKEIFE